MKLRSILLAATILALSPAAFAQNTPTVAPVTSAPVSGDNRMHEAWQRFEQEQAQRKEKFEQEQNERAQRFAEMQAKHKAEFEQRMQQWQEKRAERREERPNFKPRPAGSGVPVVTPVAPTAPVAPTPSSVQ